MFFWPHDLDLWTWPRYPSTCPACQNLCLFKCPFGLESETDGQTPTMSEPFTHSHCFSHHMCHLIFVTLLSKGSSNYLYGFTNPDNVRITVGGWIWGSWMFGFGSQNNPYSVHLEILSLLWGVRIFLVVNVQIKGVGGWASRNPNVVRICKSVRIIGRSLKEIVMRRFRHAMSDKWYENVSHSCL